MPVYWRQISSPAQALERRSDPREPFRRQQVPELRCRQQVLALRRLRPEAEPLCQLERKCQIGRAHV